MCILTSSFFDNTAAYYYARKPSDGNIFAKMLTTMTPRRYVYWDEDDTGYGSVFNGVFTYMSVQFVDDNPILGKDYAIQIGSPFTITEALAHYDAIKHPYPKGIMYKLTTGTADTNYGGNYTRVLIDFDGTTVSVHGIP